MLNVFEFIRFLMECDDQKIKKFTESNLEVVKKYYQGFGSYITPSNSR